MLAKQLQSDPQKAGLLDKITKQTFRASEIVNNLLNFSRTTGTELTEISLNKVIADTLALLEHQFKVAHIQVQSGTLREASVDSGQRRASAAGIPEFISQCQGRNGGRRNIERGHVERRLRQRAGLRYRHRALRRKTFSASTTRSLPPRRRPRRARIAAPVLDSL